ncbi:MAG TPA: hypothetical protein VJT69_19540 [Pyrinomonadaceae bacterium]|nr:hypothetical protein [Pyrinomonadaceae bacterium]
MSAGIYKGQPPGPPNTGAGGLPFPLPPTFPPGVNPETYKVEEVTRLLKSAAYFPIFNSDNPNMPNQPVPLIPGIPVLSQYLLTAVNVNEELHRFQVLEDEHCGLRASNQVGEPVANVHIRWTPIPENFQAAPDVFPPTTILNPFVSQRFTMLNGQLSFKDARGSGFRAFGTGRTFPVTEDGQSRLRIGAVIEILEGLGEFAGMTGAFVINGYIQPPMKLGLNLMVRVMDPQEKLRTEAEPAPLRPVPDPDPSATFMFFMGETDTSKPVKLNLSPSGQILGSQVYERLRLVRIDFDLASGAPRSRTVEGPIVGDVSATLHFNPLAPTTVSPIQTTNGVFTFYDRKGNSLGTVLTNMVEGRAMRTPLQGAPMPVFRFAGFGPILGGTGFFDQADGMMSMNSAISVFPRTLSNLYVFRFYDPQGRFREAMKREWHE